MSHIEADPIPHTEVSPSETEPSLHSPPEPEPGYAPPRYSGARGWAPGAALLGVLLSGAAGLTLTAERNPLLDAAANPREETPGLASPDQEYIARVPADLEFVGPPTPADTPADPTQLAGAAPFFPTGPGLTGITPSGSGLRGGIGYFGPVAGPLNTDLSGVQVVRGPIWTGQPLPAIGGGALPQPESLPGQAQNPQPPAVPEVGSELPDMQKLALARLANPQIGSVVRRPAPPTPAVSAEKPLSVSLSVARPTSGYEPGATVAVRASASADAYFVLIGVDGEGRATTLFKSPGAAKSFAYAIRAQTQAGPQYVVVVASAQPPTGGDVAAAMRAHGPAFISPMTQVVNEAGQPGSAWAAAVAHAAGLAGGSKGWKRFEWSVSAASFLVLPPAKVAERPILEKPEKPEKPAVKPEAPEGSVLPAKPEAPASGGEKSVMPTAKPAEGAKPSAPAETGK